MPVSFMEHFTVVGVGQAVSGPRRPTLQWVVLPPQCYFGVAAIAGLWWLLEVMFMVTGPT